MNVHSYCVNVGATFLGEGEFNVIISVDFLFGQGGKSGKFLVLTMVCQWPGHVVLEALQIMDDLLCICTFPLHSLYLFDPTNHSCYSRRHLDTLCGKSQQFIMVDWVQIFFLVKMLSLLLCFV